MWERAAHSSHTGQQPCPNGEGEPAWLAFDLDSGVEPPGDASYTGWMPFIQVHGGTLGHGRGADEGGGWVDGLRRALLRRRQRGLRGSFLGECQAPFLLSSANRLLLSSLTAATE